MSAAPVLGVLAVALAAGVVHHRRGSMKSSFPDVWTVEVAPGQAAAKDRPAVGPTYRHLTVGTGEFPQLESAGTLFELFRSGC